LSEQFNPEHLLYVVVEQIDSQHSRIACSPVVAKAYVSSSFGVIPGSPSTTGYYQYPVAVSCELK
jgi:hypothetical protein